MAQTQKLARILFVLIAVVAEVAKGEVDPCLPDNHRVISDARRSTSYSPGPHDPLLCDSSYIVNGTWYQFRHQVGNVVPEMCVPVNQCGTQGPIWMQGAHPKDIGVDVDRKICANFGRQDDCCSWSANIRVRRCHDNHTNSDYFVYRLVTPPGCSVAYCAGDKLLCPSNMVYSQYTNTCVDLFPSMSQVILQAPTVENNSVTFYCDIRGLNFTSDNGARFSVEFYFNDVIIRDATAHIRAPQMRAMLAERWLMGHLGESLSCGVRSHWEGFTYYSPQMKSKEYFVGIRVLPTTIRINEKDEETQTIKIVSTIPPTCIAKDTTDCGINIRVVAPERLVASQNNQSQSNGCLYRISRENWDEHRGMAYDRDNPLQIRVRRDAYVHDDGSHVIQLDIVRDEGQGAVPTLWDGYKIDEITVNIGKDVSMGTCMATSDPHLTTWDKRTYDILFHIGEFVLLKSSSRRIFEVHIRFWQCRPSLLVACVCAVAVREGNSVISINMCRKDHQVAAPRPKITKTNTDQWGATVTRDLSGRRFSINMQSGAYVRADIHDWGLNVFAAALSEDRNKTSGLCGTFDDNPENDFVSREGIEVSKEEFIESWRVSRGTSLFDRRPDPMKTVNRGHPCSCTRGRSGPCDLAARLDASLEVTKVTIPVTPLVKLPTWGVEKVDHPNRHLRMRREVSDDLFADDIDDEVDDVFDYGTNPLPRPVIDWPTETGITESQARSVCEETLRSANVFEICSRLPGAEVMSPVDSCVKDIKYMDDLSWSNFAVSQMEFACVTVAVMSDVISGSAMDALAGHICAGRCQNQGACEHGICTCFKGNDGPDCSLVAGQAPEARYIHNNGLCDVTLRPCSKVRVIASGVMDSPQLTCRVTHVAMTLNGTWRILESLTFKKTATMISSTEVTCTIPALPASQGTNVVHGAFVSVSNDGRTYSEELLLTIYDSTCVTCIASGNCYQKPSSCLVADHCYGPGDSDPEDWCKFCDPTQSVRGLIRRSDNQSPYYETPSKVTKLVSETLFLDIVAIDPEGQRISYVIDFSTNPSISLDANGTLRWTTHKEESIRVEVSATDPCGAQAVKDFDLSTIQCKCQNGGECQREVDKPVGQGFYTCLCPSGFIGELCEHEINECRSNPCIHGSCTDLVDMFVCHCEAGYIGVTCDMSLMTSPEPPRGIPGKFSDWTSWGPCSKPCDYGIMSRRRDCPVLPCVGEGSQTRVCNRFNCPENNREKREGAILVVRDTSVVRVRVHEDDIIDMVSKGLNALCRLKNSCCRMAGQRFRNTSSDVVVREDFYVAGSYPRLVEENIFAWKIIGMVHKTVLRESCTGSLSRRRRDVGESFIPPEVIREAVLLSKDDLKLLYGVMLDDVKLPAESNYVTIHPDDYYRTSPDAKGVTSQSSDNLTLIIGACVGTVISVVLVILVTILVVKKTRKPRKVVTRRSCDNRSNSMKYLTSIEHLEVVCNDNTARDMSANEETQSDNEPITFFYGRADSTGVKVDPDPSSGSHPGAPDGRNVKEQTHEEMAQLSCLDSSAIELPFVLKLSDPYQEQHSPVVIAGRAAPSRKGLGFQHRQATT